MVCRPPISTSRHCPRPSVQSIRPSWISPQNPWRWIKQNITAEFSLHPNRSTSASTHVLHSGVDNDQVCPLLQAVLPAQLPRALGGGNVIQAGLEVDPSFLEVGICCKQCHMASLEDEQLSARCHDNACAVRFWGSSVKDVKLPWRQYCVELQHNDAQYFENSRLPVTVVAETLSHYMCDSYSKM